MAAKIDLLPPAPTRADPANFPARADAFVTALALLVAQANALSQAANDNAALAQASAVSAVNAPGSAGTSTTSLTVGTGQQNLAIQSGKAFVPGQFVTIARTSDPSTYMIGQVGAYTSSSGALAVNVTLTNGAGTYTDWTVSLSAPVAFVAATIAQLLAGVSNTAALTPVALFGAAAPVVLPYAATITPAGGINFEVTLTGNATLAAPTGFLPGQSGVIEVKQDATGGRQLGYASGYDFGGFGVPVLSAAPGKSDFIFYTVNSAGKLRCTYVTGFTA